ncbi:MAG: epoxyqueuosine reductase QueH [Bacilli bacterium]|nr:epoxyqueuosine reductase QueH [Bacilli bacterium]MDD3304897.1 epoxyqueuosine reductase QueH [Bacilli bacterium]MDD4053503.1 epoxyqueuosine reductase QueH [Bacilli bacterium]MDD4411538.1 epoxyqueuosine reductase QueH [Bacilli bacterium]
MKLLMHMCCAPCSTYLVSSLRKDGINVTGLFYNPNIHPIDEYQRRLDTVNEYSKIVDLDVRFIDDYMEDVWRNYNGVDDSRCKMCYSIRLDMAAKYAKENGYDAFTSSLLVSPYQKHDLIKELGEKFANKYDVDFYYYDFRPYFREGQAMAREMNLYRQKYCGCIISYNERIKHLNK